MARVKGTVTKAAKGKFSYFILLDGNDFYYNTKFEPKCGEGDVVGIEYTPKGDTRGNITKLKVLEDNSGGYSASNSERSGGGAAAYARSGGGDRQDSIIWQSCQKVAAALVQAEVTAGSLASKGTADSKQKEIKGRYDELTVSLFEDACDPRNSSTFKEVKGIEEDASAPEPSNESDSDEWDDDEWSD